jgi:septum formation protein
MPHPSSLPVVLGSRSPRRRELLSLLVPSERIVVLPPSDPHEPGFEGLHDDSSIQAQLLHIATLKNQNVRHRAECPREAWVLTADTTIVAGEPGQRVVLGQPPERPDWPDTVRSWFQTYYLGRSHRALTGVVLTLYADSSQPTTSGKWSAIVETEVAMHSGSPELVEWYLQTGEPVGKAGGYALQGAGSVFISQVTGSLSNVVGLPLEAVRQLLAAAGAIAS